MRKLFGTLAAFSFVVTFVSCQKQSELDPPSPTNPNQKHYGLWRVRTTTVGLPKKLNVWEFKYDDSKRITDFIVYNIDSNTTTGRPDTSYDGHKSYFYKGNDTLPYKSTATSSVAGLGTTIYYIYDSQGRKILDSNESKDMTNLYYWDRVFYNYSNDKIVVTEISISPLLGTRYYSDTIYISSQKNISKIVHRVERPGYSVGTPQVTYAYDDKKNPFYDMNIMKATFFNGQEFNYLHMYFGFNPNNETENVIYDNPRVGPYRTTTTYTYNADGYPVKAVSIAPNGVDSKTILYDY